MTVDHHHSNRAPLIYHDSCVWSPGRPSQQAQWGNSLSESDSQMICCLVRPKMNSSGSINRLCLCVVKLSAPLTLSSTSWAVVNLQSLGTLGSIKDGLSVSGKSSAWHDDLEGNNKLSPGVGRGRCLGCLLFRSRLGLLFLVLFFISCGSGAGPSSVIWYDVLICLLYGVVGKSRRWKIEHEVCL